MPEREVLINKILNKIYDYSLGELSAMCKELDIEV